MSFDPGIAVAGLIVGFTVGLTGMGGGALMTPMLVLLFKVDPLTAVSSDLMASFIMKPVGAGVHLREGTVDLRMVRWLVLGSVPSAFVGVVLLGAIGQGDDLQQAMKVLLGAALLLASTTIVIKAVVQRRRGPQALIAPSDVVLRPLPTVGIGILGGLVVGMTSVGSGSLMIVLLLVLYPSLRASQLVGTDLVQAIPLVGAASLAHLVFGDFSLGLTASLLVGALPAVYLGARLSSRAPDRAIRPVLVAVLAASGMKLLGVPTTMIAVPALTIASVGAIALLVARYRADVAGALGPTDDPAAAELVEPVR